MEVAHRTLQNQITELGRVTASDTPDRQRLVAARWRISQASLTRRLLWRRLYQMLLSVAAAEDAVVLKQLQRLDDRMIRASSDHTARWSTNEALARWNLYCLASEAVRHRMSGALATERRLLFPLLARYAAVPLHVNV
jgi:hypothetical protein